MILLTEQTVCTFSIDYTSIRECSDIFTSTSQLPVK